MIFDKLCGMVERHLPNLRKTVERAHLFHFEDDPANLPVEYSEAELDGFRQQFTLPFPVAAIEDEHSCIVFEDTEDRQIGVQTRRNYIEIEPVIERSVKRFQEMADPEKAVAEANAVVKNIREKWGEVFIVTFGSFAMEPETLQTRVTGEIHGSMFMSKDKASILPPDVAERRDDMTIMNIGIAMQELIALNNLDRFVVERRTKKLQQAGKGRIPRSHQRPLYTLLTPKRIFELLGVESGPTPRGTKLDRKVWRRRHWRWYKHERYTEERRAKPQLIDATWVGPTEAEVGPHFYRVRLDL